MGRQLGRAVDIPGVHPSEWDASQLLRWRQRSSLRMGGKFRVPIYARSRAIPGHEPRRMTRSRSSPGVPTRKIKRLRDADRCLLSPTSALVRITDSSQTSRQVRNVPGAGFNAPIRSHRRSSIRRLDKLSNIAKIRFRANIRAAALRPSTRRAPISNALGGCLYRSVLRLIFRSGAMRGIGPQGSMRCGMLARNFHRKNGSRASHAAST
jgi:hypothetical protein